jgi:hypothetical protein
MGTSFQEHHIVLDASGEAYHIDTQGQLFHVGTFAT